MTVRAGVRVSAEAGAREDLNTRAWVVAPALALIAAAVLWPVSQIKAAPGQVAAYAFSEAAGPTTVDLSGSGLTGNLVNTTWVPGRNGTGLSFDGATSLVDLGDPTALQFTGSFTVSAWVYETANVGDDGQIVAKSDGGSGFQLKSTPDTGQRTFAFGVANPSGAMIQRYSQTVRTLNTWYHVTGSYDAVARTLDIYVNGVLDNGAIDGLVPTSMRSSPVNVNLGQRAGGFHIQGIIDDVRVYSRALTPSEIQADMNTPVGGTTDALAPSVPQNLSAAPVSSSRIDLTWDASVDDTAVTGYRIYRGGVPLKTSTTTSTSDTGLAAGTTYSYTVTAYDAVGNESAPSTAAATQTTAAPVAFDFALGHGGNVTVVRGGTATNSITTTLTSGTAVPVTFSASGLPAGATATFSPTSCGPSCTSTMTITTSASTPAATSTITVTAAGGSVVRTSTFSLTVTAPPVAFDFALINGGSVTVPQAGSATNSVSTTVTSGTAVAVSFSASGLPAGASATFSPASCSPPCATTMTIFTTGSTPLATSTVTVTATAGSVVRTSSFSLTVTAPAGSLVAGYAFSEGAGPTTANATGGTPAGTLTNTAWVPGKNGTGLSFDGSTSFVDLGNPTALQLTGSFTVSAWVYETANVGDDGQIIAKSDGDSGFQLKSTPDTGRRTFGFGIANASGAMIQRYSQTARTLNTWYHVAGSYDAVARTLDIYVNGVLDNGVLGGVVPTSMRSSPVSVNLGQRAGGFHIQGTLDDVRIYDRALTPAEIQADMATPVGGTGDTQPPTAPANLSATPVSSSRIDLTWDASTDETAVTGYRIYRDGVAVKTATTTSTSDTGLAAGTPYSYAVTAYDAAGHESAPSAAATATTIATVFAFGLTNGGNVTVVQGGTGTNSINTTLTSGTAVPVSFSASGLPTGATATFTPGSCSPPCASTITITAAPTTPVATSTITVTATGGSVVRTSTFSLTVATGADTTPPTTPAGLQATVMSATQVNLGWIASTDNVGVTGYQVLRDGVPLGTATITSFIDNTVTRGTAYQYTVIARDAAGNPSTASSPATAIVPPVFITSVAASGITTTRATITWTTDVPATSRVAYGTTASYGSSTTQDPVLTLTHSQILTQLVPGTTYHYQVISAAATGNPIASDDQVFSTGTSDTGLFQNEILVADLNLPTALKFLPNGDILFAELGGKIWKLHPGPWTLDPAPFLSLTNIGTTYGQQGLMDLVLDPNFATNRYYYVFYTLGTPNRDRVSRFTATADLSGTVAGSEVVIYQDPLTADVEHHGGALAIANDGKILITTGEHFNPDSSQSLSNPRGKVLRFNTDGTVPADNPFYDGAGPNFDAIWALGLRNPYRAFYDSVTGRFYVGDVGGNTNATSIEELNVIVRGANYGWPLCEGTCSNPAYTNPIFTYPHAGRDAAITAGLVYRGNQFPAEYVGSFFFADYARNYIRRLTFDTNGTVTGSFNFEPPSGAADGPYGDIVYMTEGPDGALYYVDLGYSDTTFERGISKIRRIRYAGGNQAPTAVASALPPQGAAPLLVQFSSGGSADPEGSPLTYSWTFGDGATSTEANPVHVYAQTGAFVVRLTVSDGTSSTLAAPLTVTVGNRPVAAILSPATGTLFRAGDTLTIVGDASDAEDGPLPASAFTWNIDFLHEGHVHPGLPQTGLKTATLAIPLSGHDYSGNTRYRVTLTVTDSDGLPSTTSILVFPDKINLTFDSVPSGRSITIDGIPRVTPFVHDTLIDFVHTIDAPNQQSGADSYTFSAWSDGGAQQHQLTVPALAQTYVATFNQTQTSVVPGLVAGYRFDEGTGDTTADLLGQLTPGTLVDGAAWVGGRYGQAVTFNGNSYVDLGNPAALRLTGSMTISAWIKIGAQPVDDGAIVAKLGGAGWQLKTSPDTGVRTAAIQISSDGSDAIQRYSNTVLTTNTWYHIAGVYDAAMRRLDIYVNGVRDNGVLAGTIPASQYDDNVNVNVGQRPGLPRTFNFLGAIDEVHIYNRALTATEIQIDMSTQR